MFATSLRIRCIQAQSSAAQLHTCKPRLLMRRPHPSPRRLWSYKTFCRPDTVTLCCILLNGMLLAIRDIMHLLKYMCSLPTSSAYSLWTHERPVCGHTNVWSVDTRTSVLWTHERLVCGHTNVWSVDTRTSVLWTHERLVCGHTNVWSTDPERLVMNM